MKQPTPSVINLRELTALAVFAAMMIALQVAPVSYTHLCEAGQPDQQMAERRPAQAGICCQPD